MTSGPLVIESRVDVFANAGGAEDELEAYRLQYEDSLSEAGVRGRRLANPALGQAAVAFTLLQESVSANVRFYAIAWREKNAVGSLLVSGFEDRLTLGPVLALARVQQARFRRELSGPG